MLVASPADEAMHSGHRHAKTSGKIGDGPHWVGSFLAWLFKALANGSDDVVCRLAMLSPMAGGDWQIKANSLYCAPVNSEFSRNNSSCIRRLRRTAFARKRSPLAEEQLSSLQSLFVRKFSQLVMIACSPRQTCIGVSLHPVFVVGASVAFIQMVGGDAGAVVAVMAHHCWQLRPASCVGPKSNFMCPKRVGFAAHPHPDAAITACYGPLPLQAASLVGPRPRHKVAEPYRRWVKRHMGGRLGPRMRHVQILNPYKHGFAMAGGKVSG